MKTRGLVIVMKVAGAEKVLRIARILIAVLALAVFFNLSLQAAYLKNVPQTVQQPDGTTLNCFATGDEYHHWMHDANNFTIVQDPITGYYVYATKSGNNLVPSSLVAGQSDPAKAGLQPGLNLSEKDVRVLQNDLFRIPALKGSSTVSTTGTVNNIVIFVRFNDQAEYNEPLTKYSLAFNDTGSASMTEYFKEISGAQLTINTSLFPQTGGSTVVSYKDSKPRNYYCKFNAVSNTDGYQNDTERTNREMTLLKDATEAVKSQIESTGLDYDTDKNGQIDNVCFIIQGSTDGWAELLWPHMWALYAYNVTINGAKVWNYNFQTSQTFGVGVLCHEMSHTLGFPDLYRYSNYTVNPVSSWDIMASTANPPQHPSLYMKQKYGNWVSSIPEISANGTYTLKPISSDPFAGYRINCPNNSSEYFVVEYRKTAGLFDAQLLGSGLIIYRVNPSLNGNSFGPPDEVYVFRPNGTTTVDGNLAQAFFSANEGRTSFGPGSNTTCFLSDGSAGGFQINNIGTSGETITFTVSFGNAPASVLAVSPLSRDVAVSAGTASFNVSNTGGGTMNWTAAVTGGTSWARITSGSTGSNSGTIMVSVDANPGSTPRTATISVTAEGGAGGPKTLNIVQAANGSILSVTPDSRSLSSVAASESFTVANNGGGSMNWTASVTTGSNWARIASGVSGTNAGTITVSVDNNTDSNPRTAIITISAPGATGGPATVSITQEGSEPALTVTPDSRNVSYASGTESFSVSNTGTGNLIWTASVTTGSSWARIASGTSGTNAGTIMVSADANTNNNPRTAIITISAPGATGGPKTVSITQEGTEPVLTVTPDSRNVSYATGNESFSVTNSGSGNMNWTASVTTGSNWARIASGTSGTNAGTIMVSVDANTDSSPRTASITVSAPGASNGQKTLTVIQAANEAILNVTPDSRSLSSAAGSESFSVTNNGGGNMNWTATVTAGSNWARIASGTSGTNAGTIMVSVDANTDSSSRTASITVSAPGASNGQKTLTIIQAANEAILTITPDSRNVSSVSGNESFTVSNAGGGTLNWTASVTTGSNWLRISSGSNGTNEGDIAVSYDANPESAPRTAMITVTSADAAAGQKTIFLTQDANESVLSVGPETQTVDFSGGFTTFSVSNSGGGNMNWTATVTSGSEWAHIISGNTGTNAGTITVSADGNSDNDFREASISVYKTGSNNNPQIVRISQAANKPRLNVNLASHRVESAGGTTYFSVSNSGGGSLRWSASITSGSSWAKIISGSNGSNDGTIWVEVDANTGIQRNATITISAEEGTVNRMSIEIVQSAKEAQLAIDPDMQTVDYTGARVNFGVTKTGAGTLSWTAEVSEGPSWVHITAGSTGNDDGLISVDVDPNNGAPRTATIRVTSSDSSAVEKILTIKQDVANGIETLNTGTTLTVYPNPIDRQCTVQIDGFSGSPRKLEVFNMMGQLEADQMLNQERTTIDMSGLPQGVYLFRVTSDNNILSQKRVVKN